MSRARELGVELSFLQHGKDCMLEQPFRDIPRDAVIECTCDYLSIVDGKLAAYAAAENAEITAKLQNVSIELGEQRGLNQRLGEDLAAAESREAALREALLFAKEVIDDQAKRFHQECRCQLCESLPMAIDAALAPESKPGEEQSK